MRILKSLTLAVLFGLMSASAALAALPPGGGGGGSLPEPGTGLLVLGGVGLASWLWYRRRK